MAERIGEWLLSGLALGGILGFAANSIGWSDLASLAVGLGCLVAAFAVALMLPTEGSPLR